MAFDSVAIGKRIAEARLTTGLTQRDLARRAGVSLRSLQNYETGKIIPFRHIDRIAYATGRTSHWLLYGTTPVAGLSHEPTQPVNVAGNATPVSAIAWALRGFDSIRVVYSTEDRWDKQGWDPDWMFAQFVTGEITGVVGGHDGEETTRLGKLRLARIDLGELDTGEDELFEVLDSHSSEWCTFIDVPLEYASALVICDEVQVVPEARGYGIGLHVLARAIRTWAWSSNEVVALICGSLEDAADDAATRLADGEKLARYWSRLGFQRLERGNGLPVLFESSSSQKFWETIEAHCSWTSPSSRA